MKNPLARLIQGVLLGSYLLCAPADALEIPREAVERLKIPAAFTSKLLYKNDHELIFKTDDIIFAQGKFNKKFCLKTPYGKVIAISRLYELVPHNRPLLVIRNDGGHVLGYVQLENYRWSQVLSPVTGIVYNKSGVPVIKAVFALTSSECSFYATQRDDELLAATKKGKEGDSQITFSGSYKAAGVDPLLMLAVVHIHSSKKLLASLGNYVGIDDIHIDELATYAQKTDGEKLVKGVPSAVAASRHDGDTAFLQTFREALADAAWPAHYDEDAKEQAALRLAERLGAPDLSHLTTQEAAAILSPEEKAAFIEMIDSRI